MANANIIQIYDQNRKRIAYLQNAFNIGYKKTINSLYYASFSMPTEDYKNKFCQPFNYVEIYDSEERVELFRLVGIDFTRSNQAVTVYECEHVLATLIDDLMFKYHQIGNIGVFTKDIINYILTFQSELNWQLGICEFEHQFEYKFENERLLSAILSVPKPFIEDYIWDWDTRTYPGVLNLRKRSTEIKSEIRYAKNMTSITKNIDASAVITRLYCLGYGEGDNQLGIESVNSGLPYLDALTKNIYGIKASILVDRRFEDAISLKSYGEQILNAAKDPYISYSVQAVDLYKLSARRYDKFEIGDIVRIIDPDDGIDEVFPIVEISKNDVISGEISITIANKMKNVAESISELQNRTNINDLYSQGATNQVMTNFADNADTNNPALLTLYVPENMVRVNSCVLYFEFQPFRAYEKGVGSAAQSVQTTSSTNTVRNTSSSESTKTETTSTASFPITSTESGGASYISSTQDETDNIWKLNSPFSIGDVMQPAGDPSHVHGLVRHNHPHSHNVNINSHKHSVQFPTHYHYVTILAHNHVVEISGHDHSVIVPTHKHDMEYGIFKGAVAEIGMLYINGKFVQNVQPNTNINIAAFLADPEDRKIRRNVFHRIEIKPLATNNNPSGLTRIAAYIFMQIFTNSRGSGDF